MCGILTILGLDSERSDASELRFAFSGVVLVMFAVGIGVCLLLLRTFPSDVLAQRELVQARAR